MGLGIRRWSRRLAGRPRLYAAGIGAQTLWRVLSASPHEADFEVFRRLPAGLVFADIGANRGQSALSIRAVTRPGRIHSFEPNVLMERHLRRVKAVLRDRFEYSMVGVGDAPAELRLIVPVYRGREISGEASFDRAVITRSGSRLPEGYSVVEKSVQVVPFDTLGLQVDVVKIDVQGAELAVLKGMVATLGTCRPLVMLEAQVEEDEARHSFLAGLGYARYQVRDGWLVPPSGPRPLNWIYVPEGRFEGLLPAISDR